MSERPWQDNYSPCRRRIVNRLISPADSSTEQENSWKSKINTCAAVKTVRTATQLTGSGATRQTVHHEGSNTHCCQVLTLDSCCRLAPRLLTSASSKNRKIFQMKKAGCCYTTSRTGTWHVSYLALRAAFSYSIYRIFRQPCTFGLI